MCSKYIFSGVCSVSVSVVWIRPEGSKFSCLGFLSRWHQWVVFYICVDLSSLCAHVLVYLSLGLDWILLSSLETVKGLQHGLSNHIWASSSASLNKQFVSLGVIHTLIQRSRKTRVQTPFMAVSFEMLVLILLSFSCLTTAIPTTPNEVKTSSDGNWDVTWYL